MPKGIDPTGKKGEARRRIVELYHANPEWDAFDITDAMREDKRWPTYTSTAVRQALRVAGLPLRKAKKRVKGRTEYYDESPPKARKHKAKPQAPVRASVHSYSGRSRLLASYQEL